MSHNKNYGSFYNKPHNEEPKHEPKVEEVQTTEEAVEAVKEEEVAEEPKVEEVQPSKVKPAAVYATVIGGKPCKMRFKPTKGSQVINIVPNKAKVKVLNELPEWYKVHYKGYTGYMMSQFLEKE